jgi:hypothetical protein
VVVEGRASEFVRVGDEGGRAVMRFCPECGTTVYYVAEAQPEVVAVPAGGFADAEFPAPQVSVYDPSRRCAWVDIGVDGLERMD